VVTRTEHVYDDIRRDLLNGVLSPGEKLGLVTLAERFGVSQSVIREALTRLTEQDLVVATPQRGFRVRELSIADMADLTEVRVQIESLALNLAIERGDVEWEMAIVASHHALERTAVSGEDSVFNEAWPIRHREFHSALLVGCSSPRLVAVTSALRDSAELYRRWYWALTDDHTRDLAAEHRRLKELALARDADAAVSLLAEHIKGAPCALIAYAKEHGMDGLEPARDRKLPTRAS
jgi:DNA-binding GntR family transcriptional regulator